MLILASRSPARKALLDGALIRFSCEAAPIDERSVEAGLRERGASPAEVARALAEAKALAVSRHNPDAWVIGADQTLAFDGAILHKPGSHAEAVRQLDRLRGRSHSLQAGAALAHAGRVIWSHVEDARLSMRSFTSAERDMVLEMEGPLVWDCVGAYRLEGPSIRLFESVEGDYFTILGLPLLPLLGALRAHAPFVFAPETPSS